VWVVTITLIVAAVIDGWLLKVPNKLTFPMIIAGWIYSATCTDYPWYEGLGWSLAGTAVGLALLLPLYSIGGMGAGDVKLMAGVGAWVWSLHTLYAFFATALVGALLSILLVLYKRTWRKHKSQFVYILNEILTIRDPNQLSAIAAERKSSMQLLPYGIPIAIGTILYFAVEGMLL
jgi:prepilin peptidase CpaA